MKNSKQISIRVSESISQWLIKEGKGSAYIVEALSERIQRDEQCKVERSLECLADPEQAAIAREFRDEQLRVLENE